ncbi:hypothetical protein PSEMO_54010 [Pseudomonas putida]|uniref:EF-hand domain-containing protein n=1 Tax=Pseudomonas putida TaxID=303 RepID=A0A1Q9QX45_PSEPU|nr:hypothetical protein PSEMO_54010 [Pseudomonas putida]
MQETACWVSPWEWDGYEIIETSRSPVLGMAYRMYRDKNTCEEDRNRLCQQAEAWNKGELMSKLYNLIDRNHDRHMCADEVRTALKSPILAQALSKIVLCSESEWYYRQEKWDALDKVFGHTTSAPLLNWLAEKQRIKELSWWEEVSAGLRFLENTSIYFLHPLALLGQFMVDDNDLRWLKVPHGQLTFDVEGNDIETSKYFSRVVHWPGGASGITIGRGYDMGQRPDPESDLKMVGIKEPLLSWLIGAKGLKGISARYYYDSAPQVIKKQKISRKQQYALFVPVYESMKSDVLRISQKNQKYYGALDWESTDKRAQDLIIDLIYRGDYTTKTRAFIQPPFIANDTVQFRREISNQDNWPNVPKDRFQRRRDYIQE